MRSQNPLLEIVCGFLTVYWIVLIVRLLSSWFPISSTSPAAPFFSFLHRITEPVLGPARRLLPPFGMIDISPIVVLFALAFVQSLLGCRFGIF